MKRTFKALALTLVLSFGLSNTAFGGWLSDNDTKIVGAGAAICAIGVAGVLLYKNFDSIKAKFSSFGKSIKNFFSSKKEAAKNSGEKAESSEDSQNCCKIINGKKVCPNGKCSTGNCKTGRCGQSCCSVTINMGTARNVDRGNDARYFMKK